MLYGKYDLSVTFLTDAFLPPYKGSTFRGIFGHALKRVTCALKHQDCNDCILRVKCVYPFVFGTSFSEKDDSPDKRIAAPPHPYVIDVDDCTNTLFKKGGRLVFTLKLFGRASEFLPYFVYAFDHIGSLGIGRSKNGQKGTFTLDSVMCNGRCIYTAQEKKLLDTRPAIDLSLQPASTDDEALRLIGITFKTPLRIKYRNSLVRDLPFHVLIRAMLRRVSSLSKYHGSGEPALDYRGLIERAENVDMKKSGLRWSDWRRYSNRQETEMLMGGLVGDILYEGKIGEYLPLIRFCQEVNVGKQTSFGLGRFEISELS